jgi:hypothetical protein
VIVDEWLKKIADFDLAPGFTPHVLVTLGANRLDTLPLRWGL